jgi:hypothetical protein
MKKPQPKQTVSIRVSPALLQRFEQVVADFNKSHVIPGLSVGPPEVLTPARAYRWALEEGLAVIERSLAKKGGAR